MAILLLIAASAAGAQGPANVPMAGEGETKPEQKPGYWFYKVPPEPPEKKDGVPERKILEPPPSEAELLAMHPKQFEKLLEDYRQYALWKMEPQHVTWYYQLQDFARRRSRAFMNVTEMVMLQNPDLNMQTEYPANAPGQSIRVAARQTAVDQRLAQERDKAALIF
ncbi:MAG: conjugal transfer protein TraF, partial [Nevskiales bacterium]